MGEYVPGTQWWDIGGSTSSVIDVVNYDGGDEASNATDEEETSSQVSDDGWMEEYYNSIPEREQKRFPVEVENLELLEELDRVIIEPRDDWPAEPVENDERDPQDNSFGGAGDFIPIYLQQQWTERVVEEIFSAVKVDYSKVTMVPRVSMMSAQYHSISSGQKGRWMYNFTSDFDSIQRIKDDIYIAQATKQDLNGPPIEAVHDQFSYHLAHQKVLNSKPTCYMILGKPSVHAFHLGMWMSEEYGCVHVDVETILWEELNTDPIDEDSSFVRTLLKEGGTVPTIFVLQLVLTALTSESVQHRGYVLTGMPMYPQDECDTFTQMQYLYKLNMTPDVMIYMTCPDKDIVHMQKSVKYSHRLSKELNMFSGYANDKYQFPTIPKPKEVDLNDDTSTLDSARGADEETNDEETEENDTTDEDNEEDDEDSDEDLSEDEEEDEKSSVASELPTTNPNHGPCLTSLTPGECMEKELHEYNTAVLPVIELYILSHDPQKVLKLDARTSLEDMCEVVRVVAATLPIQMVVEVETMDYPDYPLVVDPFIRDSILSQSYNSANYVNGDRNSFTSSYNNNSARLLSLLHINQNPSMISSSFGRSSFEGTFFGRNSVDRGSIGRSSLDRSSFGEGSFDRSSYETRSFGRRSFGQSNSIERSGSIRKGRSHSSESSSSNSGRSRSSSSQSSSRQSDSMQSSDSIYSSGSRSQSSSSPGSSSQSSGRKSYGSYRSGSYSSGSYRSGSPSYSDSSSDDSSDSRSDSSSDTSSDESLPGSSSSVIKIGGAPIPVEFCNVMSTLGTLGRDYNWHLTKWRTICPVGLLEGRYLQGKVQFACRYLGNVYYLSSELAVDKFKENPRRYLMPPQPVIPPRICIVGPALCGKTSLAVRLAIDLEMQVVSYQRVAARTSAAKQAELLELVRYSALADVVVQFNKLNIDKYLSKLDRSTRKRQRGKGWDMDMVNYLKEFLYTDDYELQERIEKTFPLIYITSLAEGEVDHPSHAECMKYFPKLTRIPMAPPPFAPIDHVTVLRFCDYAVENAAKEGVVLTNQEVGHAIALSLGAVQEASENNGGWILDGCPMIEEVWDTLEREGTFPCHVVCIQSDLAYEEYRNRIGFNAEEPITSMPSIACSASESAIGHGRRTNQLPPRHSESVITLDEMHVPRTSSTMSMITSSSQNPLFAAASTESVVVTRSTKELNEYDLYCEQMNLFYEDWETQKEIMAGKLLMTEVFADEGTPEKLAEEVIDEEKGLFQETARVLTRYELYSRFEESDSELENMEPEPFTTPSDSVSYLGSNEASEKSSLNGAAGEDDEFPSFASNSADSSVSSTKSPLVMKCKKNRFPCIPFGDTGKYCPVILHKRRVLYLGNKDCSCEYKNKVYYMSSDVSLDAFMENPEKYCNFTAPFHRPPLRICIVGPVGSGKTTVAEQLAPQLGLHQFTFEKEFIKVNWKEGTPKLGRQFEDAYEVIAYHLEPSIFNNNFGSDNLSVLEVIPEEDESLVALREELEYEFMRQNDMREYLRYNKPIHDPFVNFVLPMWKREPYLSGGMILDGYPRTLHDMYYMDKWALRPQVIIELQVPPTTSMSRMMDLYLSEWDKRNAVREAVKNTDDSVRLAAYEAQAPLLLHALIQAGLDDELLYWEAMEEVREERTQMLREDLRMMELDIEMFEYEDPEETIMALEQVETLREELTEKEQEELEDDELTMLRRATHFITERVEMMDEELEVPRSRYDVEFRNEADVRLEQELIGWSRMDDTSLRRMQKYADETHVPWITVDADRCLEDVIASVKLHQEDDYWWTPISRPDMLQMETRSLDLKEAEDLLEVGYYFLSHFGRWCPVQLYDSPIRRRMFLPDKGLSPTCCAVLHRQYIYFISNETNKKLFEYDTYKYIDKEISTRTTPMSISIVGLPKIGKSEMAEDLGFDLQMNVLTRGESIRYILNQMPWSELGVSILNHLRAGEVVPHHLVMKAVATCMNEPKGPVKGYIFDGFPETSEEIHALSMLGIVPTMVLNFSTSVKQIMELYRPSREKRLEVLRERAYSIKHIHVRLAYWLRKIPAYLRWMSFNYQNVFFVEVRASFWDAKIQCMHFIDQVSKSVADYDRCVILGLAVSLKHCCITPQLFLQYQSIFMHFCPLCWLRLKRTTSGFPCNANGMIQYKSFIYWVCEKHYGSFLNNPEDYTNETEIHKFYDDEPVPVIEFPEEDLYDKGYCPVTRVHSTRRFQYAKGHRALALKYKRHVYLFANMDCQIKFIKKPIMYYNLGRRVKSEIREQDMLPVLGLMDQDMGESVLCGVNAVAYIRPLLPGLSFEQSSAMLLGLRLKIMNTGNPIDQKECAYYLENMEQDGCTRAVMREQLSNTNHLRYVVGTSMDPTFEERTVVEGGIRDVVPEKVVMPVSSGAGITLTGENSGDVTETVELLFDGHTNLAMESSESEDDSEDME